MEAVRNFDSYQPGMVQKTTWSLLERKECLLKAHYLPEGWQIVEPVVFLVGRWGCGKTTIRNLLMGVDQKTGQVDSAKGLIYPLSKFSAYYRPDELEDDSRTQIPGHIARTGHFFDQRTGKPEPVPMLSAPFVGLNPPYEEWDYHGERTGIIPPSRQDLRKVLDHLFSGYLVDSLMHHVDFAYRWGRVPVIDCAPFRAYDLIDRWFPNAVVIEFQVDDDILVKRLRCRDYMPQTVVNARILESSSAPNLDEYLNPALRLPNNNPRQMRKAVDLSREFLFDSYAFLRK